jgi:hypothetical protein
MVDEVLLVLAAKLVQAADRLGVVVLLTNEK